MISLPEVHDLYSILAGSSRQDFLLALADNITLRARGEYVETGNSQNHTLAALRALNEVMIVVVTQARSSTRCKPAYPDDAFLRVIVEKASAGKCEHVVKAALADALRQIRSAADETPS